MGISNLKGKTLVKVTIKEDKFSGSDVVTFSTKCGNEYIMKHYQECCETVTLEDIAGDFDDLLGKEIISANESSQSSEDYDGDETWTFYTIETIDSLVSLRWYGCSNGYYSTGVEFYLNN